MRRFSSLCLSSAPLLVLMGGCTYSQQPELTAMSSKAPATVTDVTAIRASADRVADWQLANLDNLESYIRFISRETPNPRGWVKGTYFLGLADYAQATGQPRYLQSLADIGRREQWRLGNRLYHADDHLVGQVYFELAAAGISETDLGPTRQTLDAILAAPPTTQMMHPDKEGDPECAKRWCWADALFMAPATWWQASRTFGNPAYADYAHREFLTAAELLFDEKEQLFYRDSRFFDRRGQGGEKLFWSRGNGWVYGGLVNILRAMPSDDPRREYYVTLFRKMSERLVALQVENGMWRASLLASSDAPPETSGTGFFVYGLAWGVNEKLLQGPEFADAAKRGWAALVANVDAEGRLGYVQQVGDRPEDVRPDDHQLYGTGAYLLAAGQMLRIDRD